MFLKYASLFSAKLKVARDMTPIQPCSEYIQNKFHIITYALASALVKFVGIPTCLYVVFVLKTCGDIEQEEFNAHADHYMEFVFLHLKMCLVNNKKSRMCC